MDIDVKEKILTAAKTEFAQNGYAGARMADIARRAEVNKALIHYYFKSKENLFASVITEFFSDEREVDPHIYIGEWELTATQKLYVFMYFLFSIYLKITDQEIIRIIFWSIAEGRYHSPSFISVHIVPRHKIFLKIILEGIEKCEFETENPEFLIMEILSFAGMYEMFSQMYEEYDEYKEIFGNAKTDDAIKHIINHTLKSLSPKTGIITIPEIPVNLMNTLNQLIDYLLERKNKGVNERIIKKIENLLFN